jgi:TonB family protein
LAIDRLKTLTGLQFLMPAILFNNIKRRGNVRQSTRYGMLIIISAYASWCPDAAWAQANIKAATVVDANGWKLFQRPYGCGISKSGDSALSSSAMLWRPHRGHTMIQLIASPEGSNPLSIDSKAGRMSFESGQSFPVQVSWLIQIDTHAANWPQQQVVFVEVETKEEQQLGSALTSGTRARVRVSDKDYAMELPTADLWNKTDRCLASVGEALLTASPPAKPDGTLLNRSSPIPRVINGLDSNSYPPEALRAKAQGDTRVALTVDPYGYTIDCRIVQSSGFKMLDDGTCSKLLRGARFYPALNSAGTATQGKWETTVKWRLP